MLNHDKMKIKEINYTLFQRGETIPFFFFLIPEGGRSRGKGHTTNYSPCT